MSIEKIIGYVMNTPDNTNPAILRGMLEDLSSEGGGGDSNIIVAHINRPDPYTTVCDMTVAEMEDAIQLGKIVTLYDPLYGGWLANMAIVYGETNSASFAGIDIPTTVSKDKVNVNVVSIDADGKVSVKSYNLGA